MTIEGTKKVECVVQSEASTTRSYTIQLTITADRKLLSPLFMVLQETNKKFGPIVEKTLLRPINVHVTTLKFGKLTSSIVYVKISRFIIFLGKIYPLVRIRIL